MSDRLAEIRARHGEPVAGDLTTLPRSDLDWLVGEVDRLRGLLRDLQWAGTFACERYPGCGAPACPVCGVLADDPALGQQPHKDCWLAAELGQATT